MVVIVVVDVWDNSQVWPMHRVTPTACVSSCCQRVIDLKQPDISSDMRQVFCPQVYASDSCNTAELSWFWLFYRENLLFDITFYTEIPFSTSVQLFVKRLRISDNVFYYAGVLRRKGCAHKLPSSSSSVAAAADLYSSSWCRYEDFSNELLTSL